MESLIKGDVRQERRWVESLHSIPTQSIGIGTGPRRNQFSHNQLMLIFGSIEKYHKSLTFKMKNLTSLKHAVGEEKDKFSLILSKSADQIFHSALSGVPTY